MYRFLPFVIFAAMVVGCGGVNNSSSSPDFIPVEKSYVGTIQHHTEFIPNLESEYLLNTDANARVYLHSFLHDLSQYKDSRVRVSGIYQPIDLAGSNIDVLNVDSIDELDVVKNVEVTQNYQFQRFDELGYEVNLPEDVETKIISDSVLFAFENTNFTIKVNSLSTDFDTYLNQFQSYASDIMKVNDKLFYLYVLSDYETLYVMEQNSLALELKVSKFESSLQSSVDKVIENLKLNINDPSILESAQIPSSEVSLDVEPAEGEQSKPALESEQKENEQPTQQPVEFKIEPTQSATNQMQTATVSAPASDIYQIEAENLELNQYKPIIAAFELSSNNLVSDLKEVVRYYFAESKHFYVEYLSTDDENKRVLISHDENLKVIARFVEDEVMDWRLVSGENFVYDQNLTLVEKSGTIINIKEGYRLFESLPLEFSLQYPMQMYYMRVDDKYEFAFDPNLKETAFMVERIDSFDTASFYKLDTNVYFNGSEYVKVLPSFYIQFTNFKLSESELDYILSTIKFLSL